MADWDFTQRELESSVEDSVVVWAEENGWLVRKMKYIGRDGCPDRWFFRDGKLVIIEFKRPGGKLRPGQVREIRRLKAAGWPVHVEDTIEGAIRVLRG